MSKIAKIFLVSLFLFTGSFAAKPLEVWIMPNGANPQGTLEKRLALFRKETGIKTKVVVLDWGEAWSTISRVLEKNENVPAVLQLGTTWIPYFASRGEIAKLDPYLNKFDKSRFTHVSWATVGIDGNSSVYSIPWFTDARSLLANKAILKLAGVNESDVATYDGFYRTLKKINEMNLRREDGSKVKAFEFPGKSDWNIPHNFAPWVWSAGGSFLKKDDRGRWRSNLFDPQTLRGIVSYLNFVLDSVVDKSCLKDNTAQIVQHFNNGEIAFILNTAELVAQLKHEASLGGLASSQIGTDSISILPVPAGSAGSICFIGGSNLAIPKSREKDPNAIKLLEFLTRDDNIDAYTRQIGFLPPVTHILNDWSQDPVYKVLVENLENGQSYSPIPEWTQIEGTLVSLFSEIWSYLEVNGLYSDEAMYSSLLSYDQKINDILKAPASTPIQLDAFLKLWRPATKDTVTTADTTIAKAAKSTFSPGIGLTIFVFILAAVSSFIVTFRRKRNK